ncbi:hypothetical protein Sgou_22260 [Streptomyces gougerotii]|uniref:Uncharacterized protein n=1 Tax=Streptomyces gougerotii TaxID=53448 RepID=A0A8H9LK50_9ACTN|nr:hypothetical protein Sgou_22260 [Streptomyces gougerotii]GGU71886.1 hypothetical protein GCM10010227_27520 [Streptomyces gougerotii]
MSERHPAPVPAPARGATRATRATPGTRTTRTTRSTRTTRTTDDRDRLRHPAGGSGRGIST